MEVRNPNLPPDITITSATYCEHKIVQVSVADGKVDPGGLCIKCGRDVLPPQMTPQRRDFNTPEHG